MQCAILKHLPHQAIDWQGLSVLSRVKNCRRYFSKGTRVEDALTGLKGYRNI